MTEPVDRGHPSAGIAAAMIGTIIGHTIVCLVAWVLLWALADSWVGLVLPLALTPGLTQLGWAPLVALRSRKQGRFLQGFLVSLGIVFLLNAACWGSFLEGMP